MLIRPRTILGPRRLTYELGVGEVASSNQIVPTITFNQLRLEMGTAKILVGTRRNTKRLVFLFPPPHVVALGIEITA
jgi:hypothetical protein